MHAKLAVDPSQATEIRRIKPSGTFARLLHALSAGLQAPREERETFSAIAILQALDRAFRRIGVKNLVRLAKDDLDLYLDEAGRDDDIGEVMGRFLSKVDAVSSKVFDTLTLVLEHQEGPIRVLVDLRVRRTHAVGEYPITCRINGVRADLGPGLPSGGDLDPEAEAEAALAPIFESQESYETFAAGFQAHFDRFVDRVRDSLSTHLEVDDIQRQPSQRRVVWATDESRAWVKSRNSVDPKLREPLFAGYFGYGELFTYGWLWGREMHRAKIRCRNTTFVDARGESAFAIGGVGFDAATWSSLGEGGTFAPPPCEDVIYHGGGHGLSRAFVAKGLVEAAASEPAPKVPQADSSAWLSGSYKIVDLEDA